MKAQDLLKWFDKLAAENPAGVISRYGMNAEGAKWIADAGSAIAAAFPVGHEIRKRWESFASLVDSRLDTKHPLEVQRWEGYRGTFASAHEQLREGRLGSFVDTIRAETEDELLEQAEFLQSEGLLAAATVIAAGALEVHLRQLCAKNNLVISGHGAIEKYNKAISGERNKGTTLYEKSDASAITGWSQKRNEAAHKPDQFRATPEEVRLMIDGVRNFIARVR